jgi:hypothetical protein
MRTVILGATALLLYAMAPHAYATETPHLAFVHEYIRELGEMEDIRAGAEVDLKRKDANPLTDGIHWSTRNQLALRMNVSILSGMHIDPPLDFLIPQIIAFYKQKLEIHERMTAISTEIMSGPKAGVDYGKMAAEMPKMRAILESIDESFIKLSAVVFATLIDNKPDKDGHMSRLSITTAERQGLLRQLKTTFGSKFDQKEQNDLVSAAEVLRSYLRKEKGYKSSDEI